MVCMVYMVYMVYMVCMVCKGYRGYKGCEGCMIRSFSGTPFNNKRHWLITADAHILGFHAIARANCNP